MRKDNTIGKITELSKTRDIKFIYFAGNWCHMCVAATPVIMNIFNGAQISSADIEIHSVNTLKSEPREAIQKYNIKRIPTLVILEGNEEIGRITEYVNSSWSEDIYSILDNRNEG